MRQIEECEGLTTLDLSGNELHGDEAAEAIGKALSKKSHFSVALWSRIWHQRVSYRMGVSIC